MQLCALVSNMSCSSAWTLAAQQVDDNAVEFDNGFKGQDDLVIVVVAERERFLLLVIKSTWTENSEYTGLWSENFDSPLTYHTWFSPSPFHRIRSHLLISFQPTSYDQLQQFRISQTIVL